MLGVVAEGAVDVELDLVFVAVRGEGFPGGLLFGVFGGVFGGDA